MTQEHRRMRSFSASDRGETLVELLVTIVIMGIAVSGLIGAVLMSSSASTLDRRQVQAQALLRGWAEAVQRAATNTSYRNCADAAVYEAAPFDFASSGLPRPAGFTASVEAVMYWNGTTFSGTCSSDVGVQRLTLAMTVPDGVLPGFKATQTVTVRKPCPPDANGAATC